MAPPPRYRDSVAPTLIDTNVIDSGAAATARNLAATFKAFETTAAGIGRNLAVQRGQEQGAAAGASGAPGFKSKGFAAVSAYAEAYNNAALRSYAIKAEADAEDTAARLEVEAGTDPEMFRATFGKVHAETLKAAPSEARAALDEIYTRATGAAVGRISRLQAVEAKNQDRADAAEGIARATDRIANLRSQDDPASHELADQEEMKLQVLIDAAQADGTLSSTEAASAHIAAARGIVKQTVVAKFRRELDNPYGDPVKFIKRLKDANKTNEALAPDEEQKLEAELLSELREKNALDAAAKAAAAAAEKARYDAGDREATASLLDGTLTQRRLLEMVESQDLEPSVARTLLNELTSGNAIKSDPQTLFDYSTNLLTYEEDDIRTARGLVWKDRQELILKRREWASGWRGTQEGKEAADRIDRSLGIVPGIMNKLLTDDEKRKRERALTAWYNAVDALPPGERQAALIPQAEVVITQVVKQTAANKVATLQSRRAAFVKTAGDIAEMSDYDKKAYDNQLAAYDRQIAEEEKKAK